jgi:hypothetical protein
MAAKITTLEVEKVFNEDVREKKISGRGIHNRALRKKGFRGGVRFPSDSLKPSQIKKLSGEVRIYNMYDKVPPYSEFKSMADEERVVAMNHWINEMHLTKEDILEGWGFTGKQHIHYYFDNVRRLKLYGLKVNTKNSKPKKQKSNQPKTPKSQAVDLTQTFQVQPLKYQEPKPSTVFNISWNDTAGIIGEEVSARLVDIGSIINKGKKYIITVEIGELRE